MEQATATIAAGTAAARQVLLDALALPEWNEAFLGIDGPAEPTTTSRYALRVRTGLTGELRYPVIEPDRIEIHWQAPGFAEVGIWTLDPDGRVTHAFEQTGPLATVLRPAYKGIAAVRIDRMINRIRQLTHT